MTLRDRLLAAAGYHPSPAGTQLTSLRDSRPAGPSVSVVIPTRNRPSEVVRAVGSVLRCESPGGHEVVVVDQSDNNQTAIALRAFDGDERLQYVRSRSKGAARARNEGAAVARAELIAFTDDGCTVPANWVNQVATTFAAHPDISLVFGDVVPVAHDPRAGVIPSHRYRRSHRVDTLAAYAGAIGMGACLSVRRAAFESIGRFDESLGPGSRFPSAEGHDLALRFLLERWPLLETPRVAVFHHDFRTFDEFRALTRRDWTAIGAVHAKLLRTGGRRLAPVLAYNVLVRAIASPLSSVFQGKKPRGFRRQLHYWQGFLAGSQVPVDGTSRCFRDLRTSIRTGGQP